MPAQQPQAMHDLHAADSVRHGHGDTRSGRSHRHVDHAGHEAMFRRRFWVSLVLSAPVVLSSEMIQHWLGYAAPRFPGSEWVSAGLAIVVFAYGGVPFLRMAWPELLDRRPGMMTLISMAITVALAYSVATLFMADSQDFFWELVTLIDIMLLGHWLEMRSVRQASGALQELAKLLPDEAERLLDGGDPERIPVADLAVGDLVLIRPGAGVPADGVVEEGESDVNEAMLSGESRPVEKAAGSTVTAGSVNGDGSLRVRVTATGEGTALAGIVRLVDEAQKSRSATQVLADKAAGWLFYVAAGVAVVTAVAWGLAGGLNAALVERVATVLVIACPHALGLAIPLVVALATGMGARRGILVRDRAALEGARRLSTVVYDKTGTLTSGEFDVVGMAVGDGEDESAVLALAATLEADSEHPIAAGIRRRAERGAAGEAEVVGFEAIKGRGVKAVAGGVEVYLGGPRLLEMLGLSAAGRLVALEEEAREKGWTLVYLVRGGRVVAAFALADMVRAESREAVEQLHAMGIEVVMLTGDAEQVARSVAADLGIDRWLAGVLPEYKEQKVAELQGEGRLVAMVGDGVNDAPALARADIGIAIGSGTDVAIESADIVLVRSDPRAVVTAIKLSRASYRKMVQNLVWASGYNVITLPLAAGVLAPIGVTVSPAAGALLMSLSTIVVALNAQLMRRQVA